MSNIDELRCFSRACNWNAEEGCIKPIDKPCAMLWWLSGNPKAGIGIDMQRKWKKEVMTL